MKYGYGCCSTNENRQDIHRQVRELKAAGAEEIFIEYEHGDAKVKSQQAQMFAQAQAGDTIIVLEVSRLARSTQQLCEIINIVREKHLRLVIVGSITLDCRSGQADPMSEAFLQMAGVFSQLELSMIRARVRSGMENARAKGRQIGRPQVGKEDIPAYIVKIIFQKAAVEGYGVQRIANHLNANGYKNRSGKNWHPSSINGMLRNIQYIGIIRSGESRSKVLEHLRIVDDKTFDTVQRMLAVRSKKNEAIRSAPVNTRGDSLLAGNVFCGHCGARLCITTSVQGRPRKDGTGTRRVRYTCQTKSRTHGDCDGQTGYTVHILDEKIDMIVRTLLVKPMLKATPPQNGHEKTTVP